jgi:hypothetical protein
MLWRDGLRFAGERAIKCTVTELPLHTFATPLVSGGMTLPMIGKLLGHTQVQTTQRCAHLLDDPLHAGLEHTSGMLSHNAPAANTTPNLKSNSILAV